jgi:integrase
VKRLLAIADDEWRSLILFGLYTGQRLGDLAALTWANVDLERSEVRFVTGKTGRQQIIPLAQPLRKHVDTLAVGDSPRQPLHPRGKHGPREKASCVRKQLLPERSPRTLGNFVSRSATHGHKFDEKCRYLSCNRSRHHRA